MTTTDLMEPTEETPQTLRRKISFLNDDRERAKKHLRAVERDQQRLDLYGEGTADRIATRHQTAQARLERIEAAVQTLQGRLDAMLVVNEVQHHEEIVAPLRANEAVRDVGAVKQCLWFVHEQLMALVPTFEAVGEARRAAHDLGLKTPIEPWMPDFEGSRYSAWERAAVDALTATKRALERLGVEVEDISQHTLRVVD